MTSPPRTERRVPGARRALCGFTLMELTGVVAIVGILAAILLPALVRSREHANRASCAAGLMQLGLALRMYADENAGALPWSGGGNDAECLRLLWGDYISDYRVFVCPSNPRPPKRDETDPGALEFTDLDHYDSYRNSYDYLGAYTREPLRVPALPAPVPRLPVMWDVFGTSGSHESGGGNVLRLDGSVEWWPVARWHQPNLPERPEGVAYDDPPAAAPEPAEDEDPWFGGW